MRSNGDLLYSLNGNYINKKNAVGYCWCHRVALTAKNLKEHECLKKQCNALTRYETHPYWAERERIKQLRKARKKALSQGIYLHKEN